MNEKLRAAAEILSSYHRPKLRIMEVCGTHTHEIFRHGIRDLLSDDITLISGPGCPVCVTDISYIDEALYLAFEKNCIICTFGDLMKVPGSELSLSKAKAKGADVRMVYAPSDSLDIARAEPDRQVVFLSVGFETTTPASCIAVEKAKAEGIGNFTLLTANKTMPGAYRALMGAADAFLYPGHVNAITGTAVCEEMKELGVSGAVAGFTPGELITALAVTVKLLGEGKPFFVNC
ncbi:MAG: hydrogenase formation protein HypD, partial [Oscillospiraceae bacterium]|nr:hydrogenase formation protein HypD [Oscillospiraceae bacterium]